MISSSSTLISSIAWASCVSVNLPVGWEEEDLAEAEGGGYEGLVEDEGRDLLVEGVVNELSFAS